MMAINEMTQRHEVKKSRCNQLRTRAQQLLATVLLYALAATTAVAQSTFGGGSGTEAAPYIITTAAHLRQLASDVKNGQEYSNKHFRMDADIDFGGSQFEGIGTQCAASVNSTGYLCFRGTFDGNSHAISNMKSGNSDSDCHGVFNAIGASSTVKNLTLKSSSVVGRRDVGGIVGYVSGHLRVSFTGIGVRNCLVAEDVSISGESGVGGIVGGTSGSSDVADCIFLGTVSGSRWVGGITGSSWVQYAYEGGNTTVDPDQQSKNCLVGGHCTIGALGTSGTEGTDQNTSARHIVTIGFAGNVNGSVNVSPTLTLDGKKYYDSSTGIPLSLAYSGSVEAGYTVSDFAASGGRLTATGSQHLLTFPKIVSHTQISLTTTQPLRDIGYDGWISITIPSQEFTGTALSPAVTVTDSKNGEPITLQEGTDYEVVLPVEPCITARNYTIGIVGKGNYGGQATATFAITAPVGHWAGSGTSSDPYHIVNYQDLDLLATNVNGGITYEDCYFLLENDIDYYAKATYSNFTPIGTPSHPFEGHFNGQGHKLLNVWIDYAGDYHGIFGYIGSKGMVMLLRVGGESMFDGNQYVAPIAGRNEGSIIGCEVESGVTIDRWTQDSRFFGGIAGYQGAGSIINCISNAGFYTDIFRGINIVGGIVGQNERGTVSGSDFSGSLGGLQTGGIVAVNGGVVEGCTNRGIVSGYEHSGGIVGLNKAGGTVTNNRNLKALPEVQGKEYRGSIIGQNLGTATFNYYNFDNGTYDGCDNNLGGINGSDVAGQAMRGYTVSAASKRVFIQLFPNEDGDFPGLAIDGTYYVGAGEKIGLVAEGAWGFESATVTANGTPLVRNSYEPDLQYYNLVMPAQNVLIDVVNPVLVLLDDDSQEVAKNQKKLEWNEGQTADVMLSGRTLYRDGKWNTLCLPFDVTLSGSPLGGAEARRLEDAHMEGTTLHLTFSNPVETLLAGTPYIIKWAAEGTDIVSPVFSGVTISSSRQDYDNLAPAGELVRFIGNYATTKFTATDYSILLMGKDNTLFYPAAGASLGGMRAYFKIGDGMALAPQLTAFSIDFGGEATAIHNSVRSSSTYNEHSAVYTLDGRKVPYGSQSMTTGHLRKGIYIVNGKKIVIK